MDKIESKINCAELDKMSEEFVTRCRESGLKVTPQRTTIYRILVESREHPSAERVYQHVRKELPNISLDTVNRTLLTLNEIGSAFIVEGSGDAKRFDGNLENHQHFKCVKCKRIIDFHHKPFDNISIPKILRNGFKILRKTVYFEGVCNMCSKNKK